MGVEPNIDYASTRRRFPWVGLGPSGETELSSRYREIMTDARVSREILDAIDEIRRGA